MRPKIEKQIRATEILEALLPEKAGVLGNKDRIVIHPPPIDDAEDPESIHTLIPEFYTKLV